MSALSGVAWSCVVLSAIDWFVHCVQQLNHSASHEVAPCHNTDYHVAAIHNCCTSVDAEMFIAMDDAASMQCGERCDAGTIRLQMFFTCAMAWALAGQRELRIG